MTREQDNKRIVVFGEVLFDVFPDGERIIGGAPFNVACHLKALGLEPLLLSRIGSDEMGDEVIEEMKRREMDVSGLQVDNEKQTGIVNVDFTELGEPVYEIKEDVAFDYINPPTDKKVKNSFLFCHGTLAARSEISKKSLKTLSCRKGQKIFCDINLRKPWWSTDLIKDLISECNYLKANHEELENIVELYEIEKKDTINNAKRLIEILKLDSLIVTLGKKGAYIFLPDKEEIFYPAPRIDEFRDSVGAGDAFSAVCLLGILKQWPWEKILEISVYAASKTCSIKGAIPKNNCFYEGLLKKVD